MKTLFAFLVLLGAFEASAQTTPIVGNVHLVQNTEALSSALLKVSAGTGIKNPDGSMRLERSFSSSDGAFKLVCGENVSDLIRAETCDISIDSTLSRPGITTVSTGTYTPVIVVQFLDTHDQYIVEKMVPIGNLHSSEKLPLTAANGKVINVPAWDLTPGSRTSTKKTTFVLAAPFDQPAGH